MAHRALVGKRVAVLDQGCDVLQLHQRIVGIHLVDALLAQADVQHLQLAHELLMLGKEERQFRLLQRQCQRSPNDVRTHVIRVVLRHQARRHVDAHHLGLRGIDIFHQRSEAARQWLVQA